MSFFNLFTCGLFKSKNTIDVDSDNDANFVYEEKLDDFKYGTESRNVHEEFYQQKSPSRIESWENIVPPEEEVKTLGKEAKEEAKQEAKEETKQEAKEEEEDTHENHHLKEEENQSQKE